MRYMLKYYIKYRPTNPVECDIRKTLAEALSDFDIACKVHGPDQIKTALILAGQEGADHPANAGKFFLRRILK